MTKGVMVVQSGPRDAGVEQDYNAWYRDVHIPQMLDVPGFVGVRRYKLHEDATAAAGAAGRYLTVYDMDAEDLTAPIAEMRARRAAGGPDPRAAQLLCSDPPPAVSVYELVD